MANTAPITLEQLFRFYRGLPHQMASIAMLEQDIKTAGYAVAMRRDREWFKVWSQGGLISDPVEIALPEIKSFENCKLTAYPDPGTKGDPWTIGWGSTSYANGNRVKQGDTITQQKADELLDIRTRNDALRLSKVIPSWSLYSPKQQAALISFTYNVGPNWYGGEGYDTISAHIRSGAVSKVPAAMMLYVNPGSDVEEGLRNRRTAEGKLWIEGSAVKPLKISVPVQQSPIGKKIPAHLQLTRTKKTNEDGLELLRLERVKDGVPMDSLMVVSGAPGRQTFRKGKDSKSGSLEPLPEGMWIIADIAWKGGKDNYVGSWGEGLGPASAPLAYKAPGSTQRTFIEMHFDANHARSPGTAGCIGLRSIADLKKLVAWLRMDAPRHLFVDYGLGSCPPSSTT